MVQSGKLNKSSVVVLNSILIFHEIDSNLAFSDDRARGPAEPAYYRDSRPPLRSRSRDRVAPRDRSRERDRERDRGYAPAPAYDSRGPPSDYGYAYPPRGGGGGGGGYPAESRRDYDRGAREYPSRGGYDAREPAYEERRYDRR